MKTTRMVGLMALGLAAVAGGPLLAQVETDVPPVEPGIANTFQVDEGTRTSRVADRFQNRVLRFSGRNLCFVGCR
jgi:hypothetical protein